MGSLNFASALTKFYFCNHSFKSYIEVILLTQVIKTTIKLYYMIYRRLCMYLNLVYWSKIYMYKLPKWTFSRHTEINSAKSSHTERSTQRFHFIYGGDIFIWRTHFTYELLSLSVPQCVGKRVVIFLAAMLYSQMLYPQCKHREM